MYLGLLSSKTLPPKAITLFLTSCIGNIILLRYLSMYIPFSLLFTKPEAKISSSSNPSFRKALYNSSNELIANGNFSSATLSSTANGDGTYNADNITLKNDITISPGTTNSYKLYIWLSNDDQTNQIDLLNGTLNAKVGFRATAGN